MHDSHNNFRQANSNDIDAILNMMAEYYSEDGYPFNEEQSRAQLTRFINSPTLGNLYVATADKTVVGYLAITFGFSFEYGGQDAFIDELYIVEKYRGKGLGQEAMKLAEIYCKNKGVQALHLEVERHRTAAISLYEKEVF